MFVKSQPLDARVMFFSLGGAFSLSLAVASGASQTKGFRPLLVVFFPSIYRIFRASHNANRRRINNQIFANSLPVDARVKNLSLGGTFLLNLAGALAHTYQYIILI